MSLFQTFSLLIPILSATLVGILTYRYAIKSKKFDILYASKIPAFKEIATKLTNYKIYCSGKHAELNGIELSPYYNEPGGALFHRSEIAHISELNAIFLSRNNRMAINEFIGHMGMLCNIELHVALNNEVQDYSENYDNEVKKVDDLIDLLYKDLNLS